MLDREGMGSLRVPLAASLLLHAAVLGLLTLSFPRGAPELAALEVRLVSLESEGAAGSGEEGAAATPPPGAGAASPPGPAAAGPPSIRQTSQPGSGSALPRSEESLAVATPEATTSVPPPAPPPTPPALARAAPREPLPVEGLKDPVPESSLARPSRLEAPVGPPVIEEVIPRRGPAQTESVGLGAWLGSAPRGGLLGEESRGGGGSAGAFGRPKRESLGLGGQGGGPGEGAAGAGGRSAAFAEILRRIEAAKHYPEQARRFGHRGTVAVRFRVGPDGAVAAAEVVGSSGSLLLDAASLETIRRAAPLPPIAGWHRVRISYGLREARP